MDANCAKDEYLKCVKNGESNIRNLEFVTRETELARQMSEMVAAQKALQHTIRPRQWYHPVDEKFLPHMKETLWRYKFLVIEGPSRIGKTHYAKALYGPHRTLEINCASGKEPNLRGFDRTKHDAILFDEAPASMILQQRRLFQAPPERVELGTSTTNCHSYKVYVHRIAMIICSNHFQAQLMELNKDEAKWLKENSFYVDPTTRMWLEPGEKQNRVPPKIRARSLAGVIPCCLVCFISYVKVLMIYYVHQRM